MNLLQKSHLYFHFSPQLEQNVFSSDEILYTLFSAIDTPTSSARITKSNIPSSSVVCTAVGAKVYTLSIDVSLLEKSLPAYHSLERFAHHLFRSNTDTKLITQM